MSSRRRSNRLIGRRTAAALVLAVLAAALWLQPASAGAGAPRARASSSFLTGIGDEHVQMFAQPIYQRLHTKIVRYIAPYDAVRHVSSLNYAIAFIRAAEQDHEQVLVAFYHSEFTPTVLPSVSSYQHDVEKFVKRFPHVRQYQSWDESNRGNVRGSFSSPSAVAAARYYQALARVCKGCTVIGLDVLDADNISPTLNYISEFKREIGRLHTVMPSIWGLHNYSDINRMQSWRTHQLVRALGGQVWLTETGGIVKFAGSFSNVHGSGLRRAAKVIKYMFAVAGAIPQIKRLYVYDWTGGTSSTRFDAGLTNYRNQPREGYAALCRELHASDCSNVKLANN